MFRYVRVKIAILKGELPLGMSQGWFWNTQKNFRKICEHTDDSTNISRIKNLQILKELIKIDA